MAVFPTLSVNPDYPIKERREDSTLRSDFEGGYEHTRPRYTRTRKSFTLRYKALPTTDKDTLDNFLDTVKGGADSFIWTHPVYNTQHEVRFVKPPEFEYVGYGLWNVELELREV